MRYYPIALDSIEPPQWSPLADGEGDPTELHVLLAVEGLNVPIMMRFTGPALLDAFISALAVRRFAIWPKQDYTEEEFKDT